jgi:hypothetical protein
MMLTSRKSLACRGKHTSQSISPLPLFFVLMYLSCLSRSVLAIESNSVQAKVSSIGAALAQHLFPSFPSFYTLHCSVC